MKKFFYFIILSISLIFFILLVDFTASNTVLKQNHCYQYYEFYYDLKKNCSGKSRFKSSFPLVNMYTDEMGLRVGKYQIEKKENKKNIFIFGDSFTYGVGLEEEETYAGMLAKNLKEFNTYNFAVGSYSPSVHLYKLKKALEKNLIPEKVLVFLDMTDVLDEATRWTYDNNKNEVKLSNNRVFLHEQNKKKDFKNKNFKLLKNITSYINFNLRIFREKTKTKISNTRNIKQSIQGSFTYTDLLKLDKRFWKDGTFNKGLKNIESRINEINQIALENNFMVYLVVYPWAETLAFGQNKFNWSDFAKSICNIDSCKLIDTIPAFENYKATNKLWNSDLYFVNDEHFNKKGDQLMFKTIINELKKEKN
tara:strand:- start:804 stop:1898 length:1095 start_codon:yes stop_codon:yes gene_type:complete